MKKTHQLNQYNLKRTRKHSRGQIETFGLAFIVILISIGFFIFVSFKSREVKDNPQKEFTSNKVPGDFVLAIIKVSVLECPEFTIEDLVIDCARDQRITCGRDAFGPLDSCIALNKSVNDLLRKTFVAQNARFMFYSENLYYNTNGVYNELLNFTNLNCTSKSTKGETGRAVIPLYPAGEVYLNMNICT